MLVGEFFIIVPPGKPIQIKATCQMFSLISLSSSLIPPTSYKSKHTKFFTSLIVKAKICLLPVHTNNYARLGEHFWRRQWHPTPVLLPGKSHGQRSLVGWSPWGRVRHNWMTSLSLFTFMHWRRKWQPTPVFLPGESQGRGLPSMGPHRVGHDWSDLAAAAGEHFMQRWAQLRTEMVWT